MAFTGRNKRGQARAVAAKAKLGKASYSAEGVVQGNLWMGGKAYLPSKTIHAGSIVKKLSKPSVVSPRLPWDGLFGHKESVKPELGVLPNDVRLLKVRGKSGRTVHEIRRPGRMSPRKITLPLSSSLLWELRDITKPKHVIAESNRSGKKYYIDLPNYDGGRVFASSSKDMVRGHYFDPSDLTVIEIVE